MDRSWNARDLPPFDWFDTKSGAVMSDFTAPQNKGG